MSKSLFQYREYKDFIRDKAQTNREVRGYLTQMASAAGCKKSYLSQVFRTKAHLTPEHAFGLSAFWELNEIESEYFMTLVSLGRTSLVPLRNKLLRNLDELRKQHDSLHSRFAKPSPSEAQQAIYYSSWIFSAIHILLSAKEFRTTKAIAERLAIPVDLVKTCLFELEKLELVKRSNSEWQMTGGSVHLPRSSAMTAVNHQNWRIKASQDALKENDGIHYTSVQTMTLEDFIVLKETLLSMLDRARKKIESSEPKELVAFNLDFFKV